MNNENGHKPNGKLRVLLVGGREKDFGSLRDLLDRGTVETQIQHITSCEEALVVVAQYRYDMIVVEHDKVGEMAMRLLDESH